MRTCHRFWLPSVVGALLCGAPMATGASLIVKMSLDDMAVASDVVVVGVIRTITASWNADHSMILSRVAVDVEESVKGSVPPSIEIVELGGTVDGISVWVQGTPQFHVGEEVVLFLNRDPADGEWKVSGLAQGKFRILNERVTGERVVRNVEPLTRVYDSRLGKATRVDPAAPVPLGEFLEHVRRLAAGGQGNAR